MTTLLIVLGAIVAYLIAYHTYGRWLARKIFQLDSDANVPSVALNDDCDYVPTSKGIVFGHHFTSIAGTGPIVGPAIAIMWGWVPALVWVLVGSIFFGAVHDFGSLIISMRNRGQTVGDIAGRLLNPRVRILFLLILLFSLWIVLAIFGLVIASVFRMFPASILPVFLQIPVAVAIGVWLHRKGANLLIPSLLALAVMYLTVWLGAGCPGIAGDGGALGAAIQSINSTLASWPLYVWTGILLTYCYIASVLPVWMLLQPRDYINSLQLISSLGLVVIAVVVTGLIGVDGQAITMVAPAVELSPTNAPPIMPVLFITIACGAISGFHCLVSSGTSSKQVRNEKDAQFVGYGSMLTEGFLATIVILAVAAGIGLGWPGEEKFAGQTGTALWSSVYGDWAKVGLQEKIGAFVVGSANFLGGIGINHSMGVAIMGVLVASFAATTLDTATRLQRYVVQELAGAVGEAAPMLNPAVRPFQNPHGATMFAVLTAFALALLAKPGVTWSWSVAGTGGLILWPLFGATNQLLAGLAFLVISFWLWRRGKSLWFAVLPAIFMLVMPAWAMIDRITVWLTPGQERPLLAGIAIVTLALEAWMIVEAVLMWPKTKGVLEKTLPPLPQPASTTQAQPQA
ncbi:carbon starvation CstA family protein [Thalassoroseus pseudoceratinae]|uniref:carbon starvation CstA family protein n=1 Tax=Thalassoroseus pseudoceratinae TaxID=2713176 RepID=UPI00142408F4|nr:carbon starvation protein A [Thalassoroseus pseudoceratinae]